MPHTYSPRGQVSHHPLGVTISLLLESEHRLVGITKSEVECLRREVSNDVGSVTSPKRHGSFVLDCSGETFHDTVIFAVQTTSLQHFILSFDKYQHVNSLATLRYGHKMRWRFRGPGEAHLP